jgi:hypothetical protein
MYSASASPRLRMKQRFQAVKNLISSGPTLCRKIDLADNGLVCGLGWEGNNWTIKRLYADKKINFVLQSPKNNQ